jgi:hypothetical protein
MMEATYGILSGYGTKAKFIASGPSLEAMEAALRLLREDPIP